MDVTCLPAMWPLSKEAYDDLAKRYGEPHRFYHTLEHLAHCFTELDRATAPVDNKLALDLALWYHDAVYDTHSPDNEIDSAELAMNAILEAKLPLSLGNRVFNLILLTRHTAEPSTNDSKLLIDIDLSILGQPFDKFQKYETQIRQEYSWVPDEIFKSKRAQILQSFLDRKSIYFTLFFSGLYEETARSNIKQSIKLLVG